MIEYIDWFCSVRSLDNSNHCYRWCPCTFVYWIFFFCFIYKNVAAGALAVLAGSNPALAALLGSGLNGLTGTGPVVSGLAGAGASSLVSGGGNSLLGSLLSGGKGGKGGVSGLFSGGKGGKGKHGKH